MFSLRSTGANLELSVCLEGGVISFISPSSEGVSGKPHIRGVSFGSAEYIEL